MKKERIPLRFFAPKFWGAWIGVLILRTFAFIPYPWMKKISSFLGKLFFKLAKKRRRIIETNIKLCFPDKTAAEQKELSRKAFISAIMATFETSLAWWGDKDKIPQLHTVEGMEHLEAASKQGKGVILLVSHFTTMEIAGAFLTSHIDNLKVVYKRSNNELLEYFIERKRLDRCCSGLLKHKNLRGIVRSIKDGNVVWFAPDQDFGTKDSVFAPFMGVMTSTLLSTQRLAKLTGAPVVPFYVARNDNGEGYTMRISPELENFPSEDKLTDATKVNHAIEEQIKESPGQYLWAHRRFKTRPAGEEYFYDRHARLFRYKVLLLFLYFPLFFYTLWQSIRQSDTRYFAQRLGLYFSQNAKKKAMQNSRSIWIHAASVGEVNAALPLITKIITEEPGTKITLTSNTTTSGKVAISNLPSHVQHYYFPLDYRYAISHITSVINPDIIIIIETEIWPNLFNLAWVKNIPLLIINGRISEKTLKARKWLGKIYDSILPMVTRVFARSEEDKIRFNQMGMPLDRIDVIGNIKFTTTTMIDIEPEYLGRQYVLAASTRDEEEQLIVDAWLKSEHGDRLLVIVPRHPHRLDSILKQLKPFNLEIAVRSKNEPVTETTNIYISDTIGELKKFIAGSEFVLMGGSFVEKGGHNILEVAQLGKAVIFGPDMRSFQSESALFLQYEIGLQCNLNELTSCINRLISDKEYKIHIENNTKKLISDNKNIIEQYYKVIQRHIKH